MKQKRLLIVDDEQDLCDILQYNLAVADFQVVVAYSAEEALPLLFSPGADDRPFDLLLLDVMMPGMSGFELAEKVKTSDATERLPIIFLTAKDTEDDTLRGFQLGADDYVTKPFSVREVVARVKAVLGRSHPTAVPDDHQLTFDGLTLDTAQKTTLVDGDDVSLTKTEFELLGLLLKHRGEVLSRQQIFDRVWPENVVVSDRTVDVNMTRLRKKIGRYGSCIVSRQGYGYVFDTNKQTEV